MCAKNSDETAKYENKRKTNAEERKVDRIRKYGNIRKNTDEQRNTE